MKQVFFFKDGTRWEWEDEPQTIESLNIKNKYFPVGKFDVYQYQVHPDIIAVSIENETEDDDEDI